MKQDIIGKHRNFGKALLALAKGLPAPQSSPITEQSVINSAKVEYCQKLEDIKKSETTARIIALTEQRAGDVLDIEKSNSTALNIYERFISSAPITIKERDYLLGFFNDEKSRKIAQNIFSKVNLLQGDENKGVINYFLKNEDGNLSITRFIEYIIRDLEECRLIIPEGEDVKKLGEINNGTCYSYKLNGKLGISVVSEGKIFLLDKGLEVVELLENGMIFGIENISTDMEDYPVKNIGYLYKFYDKKGIFEIYNMEGMINLEIIGSLSSEINTVFKKYVDNGKQGLMEVFKESKEDTVWDFKTLLPNEHDDILVENKFITTANYGKNKEGGELYDTYHQNKYGLGLIASGFADNGFALDDLGDNFVSIKNDGGTFIYKFNEKESKLEVIDSALMNVSSIDIKDLMNGKPTTITKIGGDDGVYIFDKKTGKLDVLIFGGRTFRINMDLIESKVGNKYIIHFWKNGVLYKLKKGYKFNPRDGSISKGWFGEDFLLERSFNIMEDHLEPIGVSELPIDLK